MTAFEAYLREMYVTLKLDDSGCRIHSISDGKKEIVTNKRYVVMPLENGYQVWSECDSRRGG